MPTYRITDSVSGRTLEITGDSPPTEEEKIELFAQYVPATTAEEKAPGLMSKVGGAIAGFGREAGEFAKGAVTSPGETAIGLAKGAGTAGIDVLGRPLSMGLAKVIPGEDIFQRAVETEKARVAAGGERTGFAPTGRIQERAAGVGGFASKAGLGAALATAAAPALAAAGVTGTGATLAGGAISNLPFVPQAFEEGGLSGAGRDMALNTAIDILTLGGAKALPMAKRAIVNQIKGASKETVEQIAKTALDAVQLPKKVIGAGIESAGKSLYEKGAKFPKPLTKQAGKTHKEGTKKLIDDIARYDLEAPIGGFAGSSRKAQTLITSKMDESSKILNNFAKTNPEVKVDIDNVALKLIDDLETGVIGDIPARDIKKAQDAIFSEIEAIGKYKNLKGELDVVSANKVKQEISKNLFKKGAPNIADDPARAKALEILALRVRDEIGSIVPEHKILGREIHDLINVKKALDDAAVRAGKKDVFDLGTLLAGVGSIPAYAIDPKLALAIGAGAVGRKVLGSGRGASALIGAGKQFAKSPLEGAAIGAGLGALSAEEGERLKGAAIGAGLGAGAQLGLKNISKSRIPKNLTKEQIQELAKNLKRK